MFVLRRWHNKTTAFGLNWTFHSKQNARSNVAHSCPRHRHISACNPILVLIHTKFSTDQQTSRHFWNHPKFEKTYIEEVYVTASTPKTWNIWSGVFTPLLLPFYSFFRVHTTMSRSCIIWPVLGLKIFHRDDVHTKPLYPAEKN